MTRVRRRGRCAGLGGRPGGGGRGQDSRAAGPSPRPEPDPPPARAQVRAPPRRDTRGPRPRRAAPRPALRCTSGLRGVQGLGGLPRPISLPRLLWGLSARKAGRRGGAPAASASRPAGRTQAPEPAARDSTSSRSAPQLRRRRCRRAAQWERAGRDSARPGRPGPHARAPAGAHLLPSPFSRCSPHS